MAIYHQNPMKQARAASKQKQRLNQLNSIYNSQNTFGDRKHSNSNQRKSEMNKHEMSQLY